jgi:hypothetical protein
LLNYIILDGVVSHDPEECRGAGGPGEPAITFRLQFNATGNRAASVGVVCGPPLARLVQESLHRGARVAGAGAVDVESWGGLRLLGQIVERMETDCQGNIRYRPLEPALSGNNSSRAATRGQR